MPVDKIAEMTDKFTRNEVMTSNEIRQKIGRTFYRPKSFAPINCKNVLVEGVTFERSVLWNINPIYCENVIIRGVPVRAMFFALLA